MPKKLDSEQVKDINCWLEEMQVQAKRLAREFSDAVLMANLLKRIHPRMVDLNNYPTRLNTQLKFINWDMLNQRVLARMNLQQSKLLLEKLANATPGAIESLLYIVMQYYYRHKQKRSRSRGRSPSLSSFRFDGSSSDFLTVNVEKKIDGQLIEVPQKMIIFSIYEEAQQEIKEKTALIEMHKQEIDRLKGLLEKAKAVITV